MQPTERRGGAKGTDWVRRQGLGSLGRKLRGETTALRWEERCLGHAVLHLKGSTLRGHP